VESPLPICQSLGVGPYLQNESIKRQHTAIFSLAAGVREGVYHTGHIVRAGIVSTALLAVNTKIAMATNTEPLKLPGKTTWIPELAQMLDRWEAKDGPVKKMMPVEIDVPEYLVKCGMQPGASVRRVKAIGELALIAFFFLLRIGEYTVKGKRNHTKHTMQFRCRM
jgi:hypothetical protein